MYHDRLLEPKGIPLLKNESQYLKFKKTKGHEVKKTYTLGSQHSQQPFTSMKI